MTSSKTAKTQLEPGAVSPAEFERLRQGYEVPQPQPIGPALEALRRQQESAEPPVETSKETPPAQKASEAPAKTPNPFANLDAIRVRQDFLDQPIGKKALVTVRIGRPSYQAFVRVHPTLCLNTVCFEAEAENRKELYIVHPDFVSQFQEIAKPKAMTLFLTITRARAVSLWPVTLPGTNDRQNEWVNSQRAAALAAMGQWIRLYPDVGSYGFRVTDGQWGEPIWPEEPFDMILDVAFRGRSVIDGYNHPVVQALLGRI